MLRPLLGEEIVQLSSMPGRLCWTWMNRVPSGRIGNCTCGKLTAPTVEPTSLYSTSLLATSDADALLRLLGRAADVRRQNDVVEALERR